MKQKHRAQKTSTGVRQDQIAQAALHLLARDGLKGLSMTALAREVGLVPSGFYRHFKNKDAVLDAVLEFIGARLMANASVVLALEGPVLPRLEKLLQKHVELILANKAIPRVMFSEEIFAGRPARRARLYAILSGYLGTIGCIIRQGQKAGELRDDIKAENLAVLFLGLVQPAVILRHISGGQFDLAGHVGQVWPLFREALTKKKSRKGRRNEKFS
jgi:AcrR family transcriptional regulator